MKVLMVLMVFVLVVSCNTGMTGQEEISEQETEEMVQRVQDHTAKLMQRMCEEGYQPACDWLARREEPVAEDR